MVHFGAHLTQTLTWKEKYWCTVFCSLACTCCQQHGNRIIIHMHALYILMPLPILCCEVLPTHILIWFCSRNVLNYTIVTVVSCVWDPGSHGTLESLTLMHQNVCLLNELSLIIKKLRVQEPTTKKIIISPISIFNL